LREIQRLATVDEQTELLVKSRWKEYGFDNNTI